MKIEQIVLKIWEECQPARIVILDYGVFLGVKELLMPDPNLRYSFNKLWYENGNQYVDWIKFIGPSERHENLMGFMGDDIYIFAPFGLDSIKEQIIEGTGAVTVRYPA